MSLKIFLLFFVSLFYSLIDLHAEIERRASFDLGSGSIKLLIADVDTTSNNIVEYVFSKSIKISLSNDLVNNHFQFSEDMQVRVKQSIHELKLIAHQFCADKFFGVATEAFRIAKNGEELIAQIIQNEHFPIRLINQKEEAELGFMTAIIHSKGNPETSVVWDIGNGSFQISWMDNHIITCYTKQMGKTPVKNFIISEVQGKQLNLQSTPNPISNDQVLLSKLLLIEKLGEIPESLRRKLNDQTTKIYGVGAIHNSNISISSKKMEYTLKDVELLLANRIDLPDSAFNVNSPEFWVSDLIFVVTVMSHLNMSSIINIKKFNDSHISILGNTAGIVVRLLYWHFS